MWTDALLREHALALCQSGTPALVVTVSEIQGSTPRNRDTRMVVSLDQVLGTIGGGHLEWQAIALVQQALREHACLSGATVLPLASWTQRFALGPTLGQCCGGVVHLDFAPLTPAALAEWPRHAPRFTLDLHGAGHVGQAIVHLLKDIDCSVRWIDQRLDDVSTPSHADLPGLPDEAALRTLPAHIRCISTDNACDEIPDAPWGSAHLVLTHRHDLDLAIVDALLRRPDVQEGQAWVGMIGSRTKRAAFEHRLRARGHAPECIDRMACPIGLPGITGKEPAVIAVSVVAQLLALSSQR